MHTSGEIFNIEVHLLKHICYRLANVWVYSTACPSVTRTACLPKDGVNAQQLCHVTMTSSVEEGLPTVSRCQAMREDGRTSRTHEHYNATHMLVDYIDY
jgi:hypothetical protein